MTDVIVTKLKPRPAKASDGSVTTKRIMRDGRRVTVQSLDANSSSLTADLLKVFTSNVRKARRNNVKLFGAPDRAPARK